MAAGKVIRVVVSVTLDVDAENWSLAYGLDEADSKAIRDDVKEYVRQSTTEWFRERGYLDRKGADV